jgi:riboflavin-specific deaminase-like protein
MADSTDSPAGALNTDTAWTILLALADRAKQGNAVTGWAPIGLKDGKAQIDAPPDEALIQIDPDAPRAWSWFPSYEGARDAAVEKMFDIYLPLCVGEGANTLVIAHLGQSLDGRIATHTGVSQFITGDENIVHTHRLRALFDAVLVGANTASHDNPRLTTRRAIGDNATRVLLDPQCSVDPDASIFTDGVANTMVICDGAFAPKEHVAKHLGLSTSDGLIAPTDIVTALQQQGLKRIFVEGGGITVSQFLKAGALDRLHVCIAPMIIGSGRPSFQLPDVDSLDEAVFLTTQYFASGDDLLFDCQLRANEK